MDVLSLLAAIVAVAVFPGGFYLGAVAGGVVAGARLPRARAPWSSAALGAGALLVFAAALVPLPGSPAAVLPIDNGARANLLAVLLLLGAGLGVGTEPRWSRARIAAGLAPLAALVVLAAHAATLDVAVVVGLPGNTLGAAHALAAVTLLLAAPVLARPADPGAPRGLRALGLVVPALLAALLLAPPGWAGLPAAVAAAMLAGGTVGYAAVATAVVRVLRGAEPPLALLATLTAIASIVLAAIASR